MQEQGSPVPDRLDSWKAIADYLGRDVATVRRWERLHKLPVRRIAGPGRSVFAYVSEIDEWLRKRPATEVTNEVTDNTELVIEPAPPARPSSIRRWPLIVAIVLVASGLWWSIPRLMSDPLPARVEIKTDGIVASGKSGTELWRHPFSQEYRLVPPVISDGGRVLSGASPGVVAATSYYEQFDKIIKGGELFWFTPRGALTRTFAFDDRVVMGGKSYSQPWVISSFSIHESNGERRIAVTARDNNWWPAVVTVLDGQWRRTGTFVNAGWVNDLQWLSPDKLLLAGFANPFGGGMVAIVDVRSLNGQSPPGDQPEYTCPSCGPGVPERYVVLPRSEVNEAYGASLNGAVVTMRDDRILVHTIEVNLQAESVEALYEFTPALELIGSSYGDRYWEMHRRLEAEGKISHTRERCPYRNGPPPAKVWEPASGWRALK